MGSDVGRCVWHGCSAGRRRDQVMCKTHWFQLPKPLRDAIWDAYRRKDRAASIKNIMSAVRYSRGESRVE